MTDEEKQKRYKMTSRQRKEYFKEYYLRKKGFSSP